MFIKGYAFFKFADWIDPETPGEGPQKEALCCGGSSPPLGADISSSHSAGNTKSTHQVGIIVLSEI